MSDKPFDPVTEGTPTDLFGRWTINNMNARDMCKDIAARDAAMLAKGEEIGRRDVWQTLEVNEEPEAIELAKAWTPEQLFQQWENAFYAVRILTEEITREREHRASAERRGRLKGLEEAAEAVEAVWATFPSYADRIKQSFLNAIRTAAETAKEGE